MGPQPTTPPHRPPRRGQRDLLDRRRAEPPAHRDRGVPGLPNQRPTPAGLRRRWAVGAEPRQLLLPRPARPDHPRPNMGGTGEGHMTGDDLGNLLDDNDQADDDQDKPWDGIVGPFGHGTPGFRPLGDGLSPRIRSQLEDLQHGRRWPRPAAADGPTAAPSPPPGSCASPATGMTAGSE